MKSAREILHSMKRGYLKNCFVELHLCAGVCVNGPGVNKRRGFRFKAAMNIEDTVCPEPVYLENPLTPEEMARLISKLISTGMTSVYPMPCGQSDDL